MSMMSVPREVGQNIARAKSLFRRDEPIRALDSLIAGLELYTPSKILAKARFEIEVMIQECLSELNRQEQIKKLLEVLTKAPNASVKYAPGQEAKLKALLPILRKALYQSEAAKVKNVEEEKSKRKALLKQKGLALIKAGETPRGKAALRALASEFGHEPGVYLQIAQWLKEADLQMESSEYFELSIENFPKESRAYAGATSVYIALHEYEKAEAVYMKAIKQFGKHTKTLTNIAKLYLMWHKKDKAFEFAQAAYQIDRSNATAKVIMDKLS